PARRAGRGRRRHAGGQQRLPHGRAPRTADGLRRRPRAACGHPGRPGAQHAGRGRRARLRGGQAGRPPLVVSCPTSMRPSALATLALLALLLPCADAARAQPPSVEGEALARAVQRHYDTVRDFTADFEQVYEGGVLRRRTVERGTVAISKPGRMRWDYTSPEAKLFVSDGAQIYFYVPADKQVRVSPMPEGDRAP